MRAGLHTMKAATGKAADGDTSRSIAASVEHTMKAATGRAADPALHSAPCGPNTDPAAPAAATPDVMEQLTLVVKASGEGGLSGADSELALRNEPPPPF